MSVSVTVHEGDGTDAVRILIEDARGTFLFDCGAGGEDAALPSLDGVLISHAHPHSAGGIPHLPPDTPIYASVMTAALLLASQEISTPHTQNDTVFTYPDGHPGPGESARAVQRPFTFLLTQNDSAASPGETVTTFPDVLAWWRGTRERLAADPIHAHPPAMLPQFAENALNGRALQHYPVDHSILGASAIAIETSDGWIGYTGDLRFHGQQPGLMEEFVQGFADLHLTALIVDGAHTEPGVSPTTEADVYEGLLGLITGHDGIIIADFDILDMERFLTFHHLAETRNRLLVLQLADAHMYEAMRRVWRQFPALDAIDTIRILDSDQPADSDTGWRSRVRSSFSPILVAPAELKANEQKYIVRRSPHDVDRVGDDIIPANALTLPADIRASAHASFDETIEMIRRIAPRHCIPVHGTNPQAFADALAGTQIVVHAQRGQSITVS